MYGRYEHIEPSTETLFEYLLMGISCGCVLFLRRVKRCDFLDVVGEEMGHFHRCCLSSIEFKSDLAGYAHRGIVLRFRLYEISARSDQD